MQAVHALHAAPHSLLAAWPRTVPVLALGSGAQGGERGRWSALALPGEEIRADGADVSAALRELARLTAEQAHEPRPAAAHTVAATHPFQVAGGWIGYLSFEAGLAIEPAMARGKSHATRATAPSPFPDLWFSRCRAALIHDAKTGQWEMQGEDCEELLATALSAQATLEFDAGSPARAAEDGEFALPTRLLPIESDAEFSADVAAAIELVHAGDLFQVNIARRFRARLDAARGSAGIAAARALGAEALRAARYGAYLEVPGTGAIASFSPELFLHLDPTSRVVATRPIKGTRPAGASESALVEDEKERAELHMIVDLMRNDLGRVCEVGSVRVAAARILERHPTILHCVGEVLGTLRAGLDPADLLRAAFPPGSVTGAPKVRAVQAIRAIERAARGPYCGAIGIIGPGGALHLSVAIRTATLTQSMDGTELEYWAGCGIVADSDPGAETRESHAKTQVLRDALAALAPAVPSSQLLRPTAG